MIKTLSLQPPNAAADGEQLGFMATTLRVDNPLPCYWFLSNERRFIPPWASGITIPIIPTEAARIRYEAPVGFNQPVTAPIGVAIFVYSDDAPSSDSGISLAGSALVAT